MAGNTRRVLVIEDDAETVEQLVDCLRTNGYNVDVAVDGAEGLRRGIAGDYVVMTVYRMVPHIEGVEVIRRLRPTQSIASVRFP
jgi:two-component system, OmpR family, response regulator